MNHTSAHNPGSPQALAASAVPDDAEVKMVVADLDGTLLDQNSEIPPQLWPLLDQMSERGIFFVPASGRQFATLASMFERGGKDMPIIAENGGYVARGGQEIDSTVLEPGFVSSFVMMLRGMAADGYDIGVVLCGKRSAHVERSDEAFLKEARLYYKALEITDDVLKADDDIMKIAVFDFNDAEKALPVLEQARDGHKVVLSGKHWIDVMPLGVNKGLALQRLQRELGISHEQTAAFGDYLNDAEMLDAAGLSFAVANAHPEVKARARAIVPANTEYGVITTIEELLRAGSKRP
ncbi:Cof-type HAD-IIB family hydrolase [Propionibacterium sp.]|uniref:Cof-type HAD-IIB family hydrolase n=1 Tax=Propionibacterium sp. TaxID=1977903 RepID=UPI0039EB9912